MSIEKELNSNFVLWIYYSYEGFWPEGYDSLEEALKRVHLMGKNFDDWTITPGKIAYSKDKKAAVDIIKKDNAIV